MAKKKEMRISVCKRVNENENRRGKMMEKTSDSRTKKKYERMRKKIERVKRYVI